MRATPRVPTFGMRQRSAKADFHIREKSFSTGEPLPHRHEYFQIQVNLGAAGSQRIGNVERPFAERSLAFVLPHRLHHIPPEPGSRALLLNFDQHFLLPHLDCSPLDLEDVSLQQAPELAPFRFQGELDFALDEQDWAEVLALLERMQALDAAAERPFGSREYLKGCLLQLIALVCRAYADPLQALAAANATRRNRRNALARMTEYVRHHLADPELDLKTVAAASFLSPNYLSHWLRKETGKTFSELVLERRMHLARSLLLDTELSVGEIAMRCGFADEAYFSRRFRQAQGVPPSQFRRQLGS